MVINRHGDFHVGEIYRVLKPGGLFITQQVGAENDRELVELLCGETRMPFPEQYLDVVADQFRDAGFEILDAQESFWPIKFFDVGALVWFARIIEWEFPNFSVESCRNRLLNAQQILEKNVPSKEKSTVSCLLRKSKQGQGGNVAPLCIDATNDKPASFHYENWRVLSEWRDSNSRHPGPKEILELFSNNFCFSLTLFIPEMLLSRTLVSDASMCSKPSYGQIYGQNRFSEIRAMIRRNRKRFSLFHCSLRSSINQVIFVFKNRLL